jgi:Zn-dependent protease with chaperone function
MTAAAFAEDVVVSFDDCISNEEQKQRISVLLINILIWMGLILAVVSTFGVVLIFFLFGKLIQWIFSEYNVRKLQAYGCTISEDQFPSVLKAADEVCERFGIENHYRIILIPSGELNAFAIKFARKKVVVILTEMLEAVIETPDQLRALLGHELCHTILDHGWRNTFEIYKPMRYKAARELTCDNAGLIASGNLDATKILLKKLCVGRRMFKLVDESALKAESQQIYRGLTGWLVRQYLSHPPAGARLKNVEQFYAEVSGD